MTRWRFQPRQRRLFMAGAAVLCVTGAVWLNHATRPSPLPAADAVRAAWQSSEATLLDRHGQVLQSLRMDYSGRRLDWVPLSAIPQVLQHALLAAEDRRFHQHGGVDLLAVLGAIRDRLSGRARRGASTLEMQLAAQLDPGLRNPSGRRGWRLKLRQMRSAWALARQWSKPQVLEAYLNLASFRGETRGLAAATQALFGKPPQALDADESRLLVALLPAPAAAPAAVARRACAQQDGSASGPPDCKRLAALAQHALGTAPNLRSKSAISADLAADMAVDLAPHLARRLLRQGGEKIVSTLDAGVQQTALHALQSQLRQLTDEQVRDAAAVVVDNASGDVLAYVGAVPGASRAAQVDGARALRQAGSTLKPFLYSLAIEHRWLTAASLLDDSPVALQAGAGLYQPQNYSHDYKGMVSVRSALAASLNIPAVRTLMIIGIEAFRERLRAVGYVDGLSEDGAYYGYSLALGSVEVSLLEQVNAYRTLANAGQWSPLRLREEDPRATPRQRIDPAAAWIVSDILADRAARALTFDLDSPLSTGYWAAVKTGTSKNLRDNWCIGYTPRHTIGVWVGNFEGDPMRTVSGITGAAPAWRQIADALHRDTDVRVAAPPGLSQADVRYAGSSETPRKEWFIPGTELAVVQVAAPTALRPRLTSPAEGTLIALDPDIPLERQHVPLSAAPADDALHLHLDGRDIGSAAQTHLWTPLPGQHRLTLQDAQGRTVDERSFSVRAPR